MADNIGIRYGAIAGFALIILYVVLYAVNPALMYSLWWLGVLMFVAIIAVMVLAARNTRTEQGGYGTFAQLVAPAFAVMVVVQLLSSVYNYVMFNYIDPSLTETLRNATTETTYQWMSSWGVPEEEIEKTMDELDTRDFSVTLKSSLFGFAGACIIGFAIAAVIALILRRNPPAHLQQSATPDLPETENPNDMVQL
ncbi:DUF4199 domain-containing protein [Sphingobacteriales bacterium UPWRP_1]|nr:hypothetical protein B6N25_13900 [Sphingobacteriales bacterium TSM_CSS]PSJ76707.1 DUF4199 domain-containing protein [Sphingobacteriales bacterium UPWRP_1]